MGNFAYSYFDNQSNRHTDIIYQIVKLMGCNKYLELGIWDGLNINKINEVCKYCVGVDVTDSRKYFNYDFKLMTTSDFFINNKEIFDIIFIDADHNFESVKLDFINSLQILNKYGIIFIHDTDPINEHFSQSGYCGDSYKIQNWIKDNYIDLNILTLPVTEAGLTIVNRINDRRIYDYLK